MTDKRLGATLASAFAAVGLFACVLIAACDAEDSSDDKQRKQTATLMIEANKQVGMPHITNFTERKLAKNLLALRDTEGLRTWTYIVDFHGKLHLLCESIGYGLPYSVQFTNPMRPHGGVNARIPMPQPDPNGLFMPDSLSATWIMMVTPQGPKPLYVEPQIIVSAVPLLGERSGDTTAPTMGESPKGASKGTSK